MPRPDAETVFELLRTRAREVPDRAAFEFLKDGEKPASQLTYAELDQRARAVATALQKRGLAGERILLLFPPGLDFVVAFYACIYAGAIAVPAAPPDPRRMKRTLPRVQAIIEDCQARCVLTTSTLKALFTVLSPRNQTLRKLEWLATGRLDGKSADDWCEPGVGADSIAFLQYTSGSTGSPKGVKVSHRNLLSNQEMMRIVAESGEHSVIFTWVPFFHDLGLMGGIIHPVYVGGRSLLMSPMEFVKKPVSWLRGITRYKATMSAGPNFAFEICARKTRDEDCEGLDLSSWEMALIGAEPISARTLEQFSKRFTPYGFRETAFFQGYGLAEGVLSVTSGELRVLPRTLTLDKEALRRSEAIPAAGEGTIEIVSCGKPLPDETVVVVDPDRRELVPDLAVGEVWVQGDNVSSGYWDREDENPEVFEARLASGGTGSYLRTGDLGFLHEGELYVTGRVKDLIIIRGRNFYPQDIEACVEGAHPVLRPGCTAAFSVQLDSGEALVIAQEVRTDKMKGVDPHDVMASIRRTLLLEEELRPHAVVLLEPRTIPKTTSGKIRRSECRRLFVEGGLSTVLRDVEDTPEAVELIGLEELFAHPEADRLEALVASMRSCLAHVLDLSENDIDLETPVSDSGLDSLAILNLSHDIESRLGVELEFDVLLSGASLRSMAAHILERIEPDDDV